MIDKRRLSTRVDEIRPSGIRKIFDIACANPDGIDLSIGAPDFDVPEPVKAEAVKWIEKGFNRYVPTRGIPELRDKLAGQLYARGINFEDILITAGATGGYILAIMAVAGPGDEVLIADPYFVSYANVVIMCGATPKFIDTYPDFRLRPDRIRPLITGRTKAIVINHPNNPTGVVYSVHDLREVAAIASEHGLYVISDEIYDRFVYTDEPFTSMGNVAGDAIVVNGFSKTSGMTGWRLGYVAGPKRVLDAMATLQQYSYVCANSVAQKAAVTAMDFDMSGHVRRYRERMRRLYEGLREQFQMVLPGGAFYLFPKAPGGDAGAFVNRAIERKLYIIPGNVFSGKNTHFRISFAASDDKLERAAAILNEIATEFEGS